MLLKQRVIHEIEALSTKDLLVLQQIIHALAEANSVTERTRGNAYLVVRKSLEHCPGNWAKEILRQRDERL